MTTLPKSTLTKTLGIIGAGVLITLAAVGSAAYAAPLTSNANVQQAIANKDFTAFKQAVIDQATTRANSMTQEEFDALSARYENRQKIEDAIKNNDYEAFKAAADSRMLQHITSQDDFNQLVANYQQGQKTQEAILEAVKNNDFAAFKQALADQKAYMVAHAPSNKPVDTTRTHTEPTDEELQTGFNELVAYYNENGSLPQAKGLGMPGFNGHGVLGEFDGRGGRGRGDQMKNSTDDTTIGQ